MGVCPTATMLQKLSVLSLLLCSTAAAINLATWDGAAGTTFNFVELNDPVMGGQSTGTWKVDSSEKVGIFDGEVVNVPSLKAPGFIKAAADAKYFPDASSAAGGDIVLSVPARPQSTRA